VLANFLITILAYIIDRLFGEFPLAKHPVVYIGDMISFFEKKFYKDSVARGCLLVLFILTITGTLATVIYLYLAYLPLWINILLTALIASVFVAHNMLRESVAAVMTAEDKRAAIAQLVSRDTENLEESDIYKAAIETYAENLSDGVVAPLFYLLLFNLPGIVIYKAVNTMDSMVGYRNKRYEKFGKCAARLDDILNYIPSRITAVLIMLAGKQKSIFAFYKDGKKHESPNAGHPITAMALVLDIQLGGDTSYFGEVKKKATFGEGRAKLKSNDIAHALQVI
jgi:adenosylcobinamide-phosphate synthase